MRVEDGEEEIRLALEVRVDRALGEARGLGDLVEARAVEAVLEKDAAGGLHEPGTGPALPLGLCECSSHTASI